MTTGRFVPSLAFITNITNEQNAVVSFEDEHDFQDGEYISFRSSPPYGMFEVNNLRARILSHTSNQVTTDLDTSNFNEFEFPPIGTVVIPAVAVPAGSGIIPDEEDPQFAAFFPRTTLADAFDHIPEN